MTRLHKVTAVVVFWFAIPLIAIGLVFTSSPIIGLGQESGPDWRELPVGIIFLVGGILELKSADWLWKSSKRGAVLGAVISVVACVALFLSGYFEEAFAAVVVLNILILALIFASWRSLT